jgi:hypothetical protein
VLLLHLTKLVLLYLDQSLTMGMVVVGRWLMVYVCQRSMYLDPTMGMVVVGRWVMVYACQGSMSG